MRASNPVLNQSSRWLSIESPAETASMSGIVFKTAILAWLLLTSAAMVWVAVFSSGLGDLLPLAIWGGLLGGLILAITIALRPQWAGFLAPAYAVFEGLVVGGISTVFEIQFPGIVLHAAGLTVAVLLAMLFLYQIGWIRVTQKFRTIVLSATFAIMLLYLVDLGLRLFGRQVPFIHESGLLGIGFSLLVVVIAALNLALDFDFIEKLVERGAPKFWEWYAAFGLIVTLVWVYLEILRLLAKLRRRR